MHSSDHDRAPICPYCGVTALPAETSSDDGQRFVCENPDCDAFGEVVTRDEVGGSAIPD